jgi:hypothetical protein
MVATFCVLALVAFDRGQERVADFRAKLLTLAVEKYLIENGKYPVALPLVAEYLAEGKKGLSSPWGFPYQYTLAKEDSRVRVYIWTERVVGKETRVYGNKPPEKN